MPPQQDRQLWVPSGNSMKLHGPVWFTSGVCRPFRTAVEAHVTVLYIALAGLVTAQLCMAAGAH